MKVLSTRIGYGALGVNDQLGFDDFLTGGRVMVRKPYDWSLSAHAPSEVRVQLDEPTAIRGCLNASAKVSSGACEFWVNDHYLGEHSDPCWPTPELRLPPGEYRLRCQPTEKYDGMHSVWLGSRDNCLPRYSLKKADAKRDYRLALMCILCYPQDGAKNWARIHESAAKMGLLCHTEGIGQNYFPRNHYGWKTVDMLRRVKELPACYTHVLYLDATDTVLIGDEDALLQCIGDGVTVGMEACCWPEHSDEWASAFRSAVIWQYPDIEISDNVGMSYEKATCKDAPVLTYINAGMFAGERQALTQHLQNLVDFQHLRKTPNCPPWLRKYNRSDYQANCDQFLWQAYYREYPGCVKLDTKAELFLNMSCQHLELTTPHLKVVPRDGDVQGIETRYGTRPLCLHFSGGGWGVPHLRNWQKYLGV